MAGITIFGILGNLAHNMKIDDISKVVKSGTGLAFVSYPDAISKFQFLPQVNSSNNKTKYFHENDQFLNYSCSGICCAILFHVIHIGHWIGGCITKCCRHCALRSISEFEICSCGSCNINTRVFCWPHIFDTGKESFRFIKANKSSSKWMYLIAVYSIP